MSLVSPDANNIGRYAESTSIGTQFKNYMNLGLAAISARLTVLRPRYAEVTVGPASVANNVTATLGTAGTLAFTELADAEGWRDPTTNPSRITPTTPGRYWVYIEVEWASNTTGLRVVQIARNGVVNNRVRDILPSAASDSAGSAQLATEYTMNGTTDYITFTVLQNSGAALNVTARAVVRYLGPA